MEKMRQTDRRRKNRLREKDGKDGLKSVLIREQKLIQILMLKVKL